MLEMFIRVTFPRKVLFCIYLDSASGLFPTLHRAEHVWDLPHFSPETYLGSGGHS